MKFLKNLIFILLLFLNSYNVALGNEKIVILDINSLIEKTAFGKKILNDINESKKKNIEILKNDENKIIENRNNIKKQKNLISEEQLKIELEKLNLDFNQFQDKKKKFLNEFNLKKKNELDIFFKKVTPIIKNYMEENGISIIIDKKNILIVNKNINISPDIIKLIDEQLQ